MSNGDPDLVEVLGDAQETLLNVVMAARRAGVRSAEGAAQAKLAELTEFVRVGIQRGRQATGAPENHITSVLYYLRELHPSITEGEEDAFAYGMLAVFEAVAEALGLSPLTGEPESPTTGVGV